jgi:crotonobetaine/carnitine-CoA ligase
MRNWTVGSRDTMMAALDRATGKRPDSLFLSFSNSSYSYEDFWRRAGQLATGLTALVRPGECIVLMLDNTIDHIALRFAANFVGAIPVSINTALRGDFLAHIMVDTGAAIVVAEGDLLSRFDAIVSRLPSKLTIFSRGSPVPETSARALEELYSDIVSSPVVTDPTATACLSYTGGTTGPSKGCIISHNYLCHASRMCIELAARTPDEVSWNCLPMCHLNIWDTSVVPSILLGGSSAIEPKFSLSNFWPSVIGNNARVVSLLGSMISLIAAMPESADTARAHGQIRAVMGVPFSHALAETWRSRFGIELAGCGSYGLTECYPIVTQDPTIPAKPNSSGMRNKFFDVRIFGTDDTELPLHQPGEVVLRPLQPQVMFDGYWGKSPTTVWRNGWFHTGDVGLFDEDGYFFFMDRQKDYIRRRGENISGMEVEATLLKHPSISDIAVHAVPSDLTEDDVKITAVLRDSANLTHEELFSWCIDHMPYYALPRYIEFREELPVSDVGKVLKSILREEGCTPTTWDRERSAVKFGKR